MRAIIIDDKDAIALMESLKIANLEKGRFFCEREFELLKEGKITPDSFREALTAEIHRSFHFVVARWFGEQGARLTR